ncbi:hypothetical protein ABT294_25855 [Nonomuraea sp. NPDC000554]|uniref:hypothetical protein n=1 Tax=Nonomuraea sp. NPDC000554 TaxID=3154259 RepID=UPI00332F349D
MTSRSCDHPHNPAITVASSTSHRIIAINCGRLGLDQWFSVALGQGVARERDTGTP